jgi:HlyD family secretion protein
MKRLIKKVIWVLVAIVLVGGTAAWLLQRGEGQAVVYLTAPTTRGDLLVSISATGTVEPEEVIDVGAQVGGRILEFGKDVDGKTVDYGSYIEEGTILARIDDSLYAADAALVEAQVRSAKAGLERANADLAQMKAKFRQAGRDWERAQKLGPSEALSEASYDAYQSAYATAMANVAVGEAAILQARAGIAEAEAALRRAQRNLGYCTIKSPVKGVIIDRRVNIGQTVVASLNAPSLFLIAKDLRRMQVWVAVNEADIGRLRPGQPVTFTVDAFPGETFRGEVGRIRLNASMTQNVVTYTVEIITDNANGRLLPYLTANVQFELDRASDVLLVPNAALRWTPSSEHIAPESRKDFGSPAAKGKGSEGGQLPRSSPARVSGGTGRGVVWLADGRYVRPVRVRTGLSDGLMTTVESEGLSEGLEIVTGLREEVSGRSDASSPFTPQLLRRNRNGPK